MVCPCCPPPPCSGPCETSEDCDEGCVCVDGQCVDAPPPDPCTVLVDGERVPFSSFDPYEVINATWRGRQVSPGNARQYNNGVLVSDVPSQTLDDVAYVTDTGCDPPTYAIESEALYIATSGSGYINVCVTNEHNNKYQTFRAEQINATTCLLSGGIGTLKAISPCLIDGVPSGNSIAEESWWLWECEVVNGVPGEVTVSPIVGVTYLNNTYECVIGHEAPEVTLDFVP